MKKICGKKTEVYSRVVGYFRPVDGWNKGKQAEFKDRKEFEINGGSIHEASKKDKTVR
jgi:ribonucleoside-triphosphate reductase